MNKTLAVLLLSFCALAPAEEVFRFPVFRARLLRDEPGQLEISPSGVAYHSDNGKTSIRLALADIREADVSNPKVIRLQTYDVLKQRLMRRRVYAFRLRQQRHDEDLARFFAENLKRPVIGAYATSDQPEFEIGAYHRQALGGTHGILQFGAEAIRYVSKKPANSRTWLYRDIETIGNPDPFHFRITTFSETYSFDLKERLPEEAYRLAWQKVYELQAH